MIELQRDESQDIEVWTDPTNDHVIVEETEETARIDGPGPGWYVRDYEGEAGPLRTLDEALHVAELRWFEVSLAPANRLRRDIEEGRVDEIGHFLLEYLADYGAVGIDAKALANRVFERVGGDEEA